MMKKIVFLGMGGTIAGTAVSPADNVGYRAAQVGVAALLLDIPGLTAALGGQSVVSEQVAQVNSKDMGWSHWRALALRAVHYLLMPDVSGLVVTHGTDTLEETAYFLSCVLPADLLAAKPLVLTCSMRPASSLAPDGPQNVRDAVALVQSVAARGVLVLCAGAIHSAHDVQKTHCYRLDAFDSGDGGPLGYVEEGVVRWIHPCPKRKSVNNMLAMVESTSPSAWPRVEIVMNYAGATGATVLALCTAPAGGVAPIKGIVVAGTGNGTIHKDLEVALLEVQHQGVRVIRTTRCTHGVIVQGKDHSDELFRSVNLSPVKARIALMLDLMA